ncbi:hypothetical protein [Blastococcus mobilis]|uniref:Uncharacterized protein n=1 Tax=Blastococcus mobilis TaxID=1938746 RepID=A0A238X7V0_9ACTN|nr:hypothetical protein [Blastococcus mobilis]SNR53919.1 hypothetical protein SAMN06272737_111140 [Blastococcus mobilis]
MTEPAPDEPAGKAPSASVDPTLKVARPPVPGRAVRADVAAGRLAAPPVHHDEPTVTLTGQAPAAPHRTLEFGVPAPVEVTVAPRRKPRRRYRTWPWIVAVVLALVVLGTILLVMLLRGGTIDGNTDLIGSDRDPASATAPPLVA